MHTTWTRLFTLSLLSTTGFAAQDCDHGCGTFEFEGLADLAPVGRLAGVTNVEFGATWLSLVDSDAGGSGSFANEPSASTVIFSVGGFTSIELIEGATQVEIWYSAAAQVLPLTLSAFDGAGNLVASAVGMTVGHAPSGTNCNGDPTGNYCSFDRLLLSAPDMRSLQFVTSGGASTQVAFDGLRVCRTIGTTYCGPAVPNSSGAPATIHALGSTRVTEGCLALRAGNLPPAQFGYALNSPLQGFIPTPPGSQGNLCLAGPIGRHTSTIMGTGNGEMSIPIDLTALPRPAGIVAVMVGETWNFTCWFRDQNPGPTSNFTDAVSITFR